MAEMRVDLRKAESGDEVEKKLAAAVAIEVQAGNLVFYGYDKGVAVYRKVPRVVTQ